MLTSIAWILFHRVCAVDATRAPHSSSKDAPTRNKTIATTEFFSFNLKEELISSLITAFWDLIVPNLTWFVVLLFFVLPRSLQILPWALWLGPVLAGQSLQRLGLFDRQLKWVAAAKSLTVIEAQDAKGKCPFNEGSRPCLMAMHPHGRYPVDIFPWFKSRPDLFGNLMLAQSSLAKFVPSVGLVNMFCNVIDVTRKEITSSLEKGQHVALFPGGAREMILCTPFEPVIPLVKRYGFLRLAYTERNTSKPLVMPCFLFGMHDAFYNPLPKVDEILYNRTRFNLPLLFPTSAGLTKPTMVQGTPLDPLDYATEEDFVGAYYAALEELFESNKAKFSGYANRSIQWIETIPKNTSKKQKSPTVPAMVGFFFITVTFSLFLATGKFWKLTVGEPYVLKGNYPLIGHVTSAIVWLATLVHQVSYSNGFRRTHKWVGYLASIANLGVCLTGNILTLEVLAKAVPVAMEQQTQSSYVRAVNAVLTSWSNVFVSGLTMVLFAYAMAAIRNGNIAMHKKFMSRVQMLHIGALFPRVWAILFRRVLPFFARDTNCALACVLMLGYHAVGLQNTKLKHLFLPLDTFAAVCCSVLLVVGSFYPLVAGVAGPFVCGVAGWKMYPSK